MSFKEFCRVLKLESEAIDQAYRRFETDTTSARTIEETVKMVVEKTQRGGKVIVVGLGKSGKIGAKIAATLTSTGTPALSIHPTEALHGDLGVVSPHDIIFAISYTGNTEELISLLPYFEKRGATIVALTGNKDSKLAQKSKKVIDCSVKEEACVHNLAPTASTTLTLAVGDALAMAIMKARGFTAEDFALNHPGGTLGRRLQLQVSDLMHPIPLAPQVSEDASVDEIINLSTERKLGAVLVCENNKLKGIITDGDIRRALKRKDQFFSLKAREIMTSSPIVILPNCMAYDALRLMEERDSQIAVLPVVSASGDALGLLRIHDLVQTF